MAARHLKKWRTGILVCLVMTLMACAGAEDYAYRSDREAADGPGLLSGDKGYFEVYQRDP